MSVAFEVADNIARLIANSTAVAAAAGASPHVYLHDLDPADESDVLIVVMVDEETRPVRADREFVVGVSIIYRPADQLGGNAAVGEARPDGVYVLGGDPSRIDAVAEAVAVVVETSPVGAILRESKVESLLLNPAVHYASLTLTFLQITTF